MDQEKLRHLYAELKGMLAQLPTRKGDDDYFRDRQSVDHYNEIVHQIQLVAGDDDYGRFKVTSDRCDTWTGFRNIVGAFIGYLHEKFFQGDPDPFTARSSVYNVQSTNVTQQVHIEMILEMDRFINKKIEEQKEGTKERKFLERLRDGMKSASNFLDFAKILSDAATKCGISISDIAKIFGS